MRLEVSDACCSVEDAAVASQGRTILDVGAGLACPREVTVGGPTRLIAYQNLAGSEGVSVDAPIWCDDSPHAFPWDNVTNHGCDSTTEQGRGQL